MGVGWSERSGAVYLLYTQERQEGRCSAQIPDSEGERDKAEPFRPALVPKIVYGSSFLEDP